MRRILTSLMALMLILWSSQLFAQKVKFVTTGTAGAQHGSDVPAEGDPLQGQGVNPQWDAGHPMTQQPYTDDCKDDRCVRAEKRQTGGTTWQEDRASGLSKTGKAPASPTSAESLPSK